MSRNKNQQPQQTAQILASEQSGDFVLVYYNSPHGLTFRTPDGREVTVNGFLVGNLIGADGKPLPGGKFGETRVRADDWAYIQKAYGQLDIFQSGRIYAQRTQAAGQAEAEEKEALRHGAEPINPEAAASEEFKED